MAEPSNEVEKAEVAMATEILRNYDGRNKFMLDVKGKSERIDQFNLSVRQAQVIIKIADEEQAKAEKNQSEPF